MIKAILFDCFGVVLTVYDERNDAMIDFIRSLKPDFKLAMVSNVSSRASLDRRFHEGELDQLFDVVIPSGDVGYEKPDHRIYELAAQKLDVAPQECLFIDDIVEFCEAARVLGMQTVQCVDVNICIKEIQALIDRE